MKNTWKLAFLFPVMVLAASEGFTAETLKLRPVLSVYGDAMGSGLRQPEGVGCDGKSTMVVADTGNGRIVKFGVSGETLTPVAVFALPELPYPVRVWVNSKGEIFALDGKLQKIARLSSSGEFKGYVAPTESETGGAMVPRSMQIDSSDNLYVLDVFSSRVLVLDPDGKYLRKIAFPKDYGFISDLAVSHTGNLFLIDSVGRKVFTASKDSTTIAPLTGSLQEVLNFPVGIATDNRGNLFVADQNGSGVVILGSDGSFRGRQLSMGWKEGLLRYPSQVCVTGNGIVFIADRGNNRIQMYSTVQ